MFVLIYLFMLSLFVVGL